MDLNLTLNLPEPVNKVLNPVASAAGETLANIWNGCFTYVNTWSKKQVIKHEHSLLEYKRSIEEKFASIPENHRVEPRLSIVGPAIEASKYYIEEETIREMFSKLITTDMDDRKRNLVHHSFVEILKQMNPTDAKILAEFDNPTTLLRCLITRKSSPNLSLSITDIYLSETFKEYDQSHCISIANLDRLGLISIPTRNLSGVIIDSKEPDAIARFKATKFYSLMVSDCNNPLTDYSDYEIITYKGYLTELAFSFKKICL
ncbi:DUF4393 domain-containing protein [Anaeroglobus geminatus]|jgi:hypothetical protein|uniref:DUF4393 domain-containing protein n=1 Tax=Anaeroglobus geminatus F0357 TaxID=861450 RepID=G9YER3_9FIRM|nr:DUF4393 domain-containing protein [Anaeroglobus geminatus]EHM43809.1 hypothetical protein HMPREF0080_00123 [Anaeroglobus geminatus F0357]